MLPFSVHLLVFSFSARVDRSTTRKTPRETRGDTLQETTAPSIFVSKFLSKTPMNYAGLKNVHIWTRFVAFIYALAVVLYFIVSVIDFSSMKYVI